MGRCSQAPSGWFIIAASTAPPIGSCLAVVIEAHEYPETATLRELAEETGLTGRIVHQLFVLSYKYGCSTTYLVEVDDYTALHPGYDPEECHAEHQKLIDVAWRSLNAMCGNPEIDALTCALTTLQSPFDDASDSQCSIETP
jgi:ADP-ribose pyrophosphatase YjhB (NUDIX family)